MPTFNQVVADRAEVDIPAEGGEPLHIVYRPRALTPRGQKAFALLAEQSDGANLSQQEMLGAIDEMTKALASMLIGWNLEYPDADGNPSGKVIPATYEGLQDVDYLDQMTVFSAIQEHMSLGKKNGRKQSKPSRSR